MKCDDVRRWLALDLDGAAEPSADAAAHLERCDGCRAEAGRLKAISAATRAALPPAALPLDFTERVMAHVLPPADVALGERARPRPSRWWPLLIPVLALVVWPLVAGRDAPDAPHDTPLAPLARTSLGGADVTALGPALVRDGTLHGGAVLLEAGAEAAEIETPLGTIRLAPHSRGVARFGNTKEETMNTRLAPAVLTLTLLAGHGTVATAQGEAEAEPNKPVQVVKGDPPRIDPEALHAEVERIRALVAQVNEQLAAVTEQVAAAERTIADLVDSGRIREAEESLREAARVRLEIDEDERLKVKLHLDEQAKELKARDEEIARLRAELNAYKRRGDEIEGVNRVHTDATVMEDLALGQELERARALRQRMDKSLARMRAICAAGGLPTQRQLEELAAACEELKRIEPLAAAKADREVADRIHAARRSALESLRLYMRLRDLDQGSVYEVKVGDTLEGIAESHGVRRREIVDLNPGLDPARLRPGQTIRIPGNREEYELLRMRLAGETADHDEAEPKRTPRATGRVLEARGNIVALSVGSEDGVKVGDVFQVTRDKEWVGQLVVTKVYKAQSVAEFDAEYPGAAAPIAVGDVVTPR